MHLVLSQALCPQITPGLSPARRNALERLLSFIVLPRPLHSLQIRDVLSFTGFFRRFFNVQFWPNVRESRQVAAKLRAKPCLIQQTVIVGGA
jgi:hypothetical protein